MIATIIFLRETSAVFLRFRDPGNLDNVKYLFIVTFVFSSIYFFLKKGNYYLKLYFYINSFYVIVLRNIFEMGFLYEIITFNVIFSGVVGGILITIAGSMIDIFFSAIFNILLIKNDKKYLAIYCFLLISAFIRFKIVYV